MSLAILLANRGLRLSDLAHKLDVNRATVWRWNQNGVPHDRVAAVEDATGIPACDIRPDLARVFIKKVRA